MTISNNHVLHSKIVLISAYSARNRSDLLVFSEKKPPPKTGEWSVTSLRFAKNGFHHNFHPCIELRHNDEKQQPQDVHHDEQILRINEILESTREFFKKKNVMSQSPHETEHCKNKKTSGKCNAFVMPQQENVFMSMAII